MASGWPAGAGAGAAAAAAVAPAAAAAATAAPLTDAPTARDGGASVNCTAVAAAAAAGATAAAAAAPAPAPAGQPDATAFVQAIHTGIRHLFKRYTFYNSVVVVTTSCGTNLICLDWRKNHVPCRPTAYSFAAARELEFEYLFWIQVAVCSNVKVLGSFRSPSIVTRKQSSDE